jgi:hypothetical protein
VSVLAERYAAFERYGECWEVCLGDLVVGRVWSTDCDYAQEMAIEGWVDCGGEYTEDLHVRLAR